MTLDSQQREILGRSALIAQLVGDGLEVATPERDAGIDLLAFTVKPWRVVPIQMKSATKEAFSVHRKYARLPGLVMVYVWHAAEADQVEFYAMEWQEAKKLAKSFGWTKSDSWTRKDPQAGYGTTRPSVKQKEALLPYKMVPGKWRRLIERRP